MELDRIAAVLRPRRGWEAVDLGFAMVQRWPRSVWTAWCFTSLPACILVMVVAREALGSTMLGFLLAWWSKPLLERVPLWVLSRALFGDETELPQVLRELPRLWLRRLPLALVWHRLHPARAMLQPIALLEGSSYGERAQRERLLARDGGAIASLVALMGLVVEFALTFGLLGLVVFFTPGDWVPDLQPFWDGEFAAFEPGWLAWAFLVAWWCAYSITGPLNAACGFALYLNRRVHLEGWDIELVFRRLAARVQHVARSAAGAALALALVLFAPRARAQDAEPAAPAAQTTAGEKDPSEVIREVRKEPEFPTEEVQRRLRLKWNSSQSSAPSMSFLGPLILVVAWTIAIVVGVALLVVIARAIGWIRWTRAAGPPPPPEPVTHLFGLDLRPESLPEDVAGKALELWRRGEAVAALGLLYRAAISRLIERDGLKLEKSDTESDCLRRARSLPDRDRTGYFAAVTRAWLVCAYSTARPAAEQVEDLCRDWNLHFERSAA